MLRTPWLLLAVALVGCNYAPDRFAKKVSFTWCDWRHACGEVDANQAEMCWEIEQASWNELLTAEDCDYARDRSKRLFRMFVEDLENTDCELGPAYNVLAELADDICQQPHSAVDTQEDPEDTDSDTGV